MKIETLSAITVVQGAVVIHLNPILALLVVALALIVFGVLAWCGFSIFARLSTGWKTLAQRFPATHVHKSGRKYSGCDGHFDAPSWNRPLHLDYYFTIEIAQEGLLIAPYFVWCSPVLIPWGDVQRVDDTDVLGLSKTRISVNYGKERQATFGLPKEALTTIQESVPAERLHKTESFSQLIKDRLKNPRN
jgi:hypothetical protein